MPTCSFMHRPHGKLGTIAAAVFAVLLVPVTHLTPPLSRKFSAVSGHLPVSLSTGIVQICNIGITNWISIRPHRLDSSQQLIWISTASTSQRRKSDTPEGNPLQNCIRWESSLFFPLTAFHMTIYSSNGAQQERDGTILLAAAYARRTMTRGMFRNSSLCPCRHRLSTKRQLPRTPQGLSVERPTKMSERSKG